MSVCIIPARGGSKGIPRKNIMPFCGKPLVAWTIEQAAQSECQRIIVATDDDEIAGVATQYGAEVFERSDSSASDTAPSEEVLVEVLDAIDLQLGEPIVFLQATSPIRQPWDIDAAIRLLRRANADSVFSVRNVEGYTWHEVGQTVSRNYSRRPRQHEPVRTLEENGSIYVFRHEVFRREGDRICGHCVPYDMHPLDSFQIDDPADVELLQTLMQLRLPNACAMAEAN